MIVIKSEDDFLVGENLSNIITIELSENLSEADLRLEFELPNGDKKCSESIPIENLSAVYAVPLYVLKQRGQGYVQAVATIGDYIEKSLVEEMEIGKSINAIESMPTSEPDLVREMLEQVELNTQEVQAVSDKIEELEKNTLTEENIAEAVENYMEANPVNPVLTVITWTEEDFAEGESV